MMGLYFICMCVLMLQIGETRLLSVIAWYYLAFFAISMAMCGMTAGSLFVYFKSQLFSDELLFEHLSWIAAALAISVAGSLISLVSSIVMGGLNSGMSILLWLKLILSILPPYFFAGMGVSLALTRSPYPVGQVYGVDLIGAASGCLLALAVLSWMDGCSALIAIAAIAALGAASFRAALAASRPRQSPLRFSNIWLFRHPLQVAVLFAALAVLNTAIQPRGIAPLVVKDRLENVAPAAQEWNSFSRIRAETAVIRSPSLWGPSPKLPPGEVSERSMAIDGSAGSVMYRFDGDLKKVDFLRYDITNLAYSIRHSGRAAVIGVGGGRDLLSAYLFGFRDIIGVELNPILVGFLEKEFRDYNHVADLRGVTIHIDEARSWFARTRQKFNLIEMSLVDTWAATGAGAFSLSENGLYTVQGWQHFLDALTPDGVFTVSRWYSPNNIRETARLLSLAGASLRSRGVADPEKHIFLAGISQLSTIIVSNAPFSNDDLNKLHEVTSTLGFMILAAPDQPATDPVLSGVIKAGTPAALNHIIESTHLDLRPPTDNRPFFFNQLILTDLASLRNAGHGLEGVVHGNLEAAKTIATIIVLSLVLVLSTMIAPSLPSVRQVPASLAWLGTVYFALIGIGFMFVEISIIQRVSLFLGYPVYGLAIGLFSIILSTGLGSLISERFPLSAPLRLFGWAALLPLFIIFLTIWFPMLVAAFEREEVMMRVTVSLLATVPSGLLMGFGFPTGMRLVNAIDTRPTPWFWAVNGSAGVLAAGVAVGISIAFSISASLWVGATSYLILGPIGIALHNLGHRREGAASLGVARLKPGRRGAGRAG
jgi:hypothetical protein